jgi:hypothetical protein
VTGPNYIHHDKEGDTDTQTDSTSTTNNKKKKSQPPSNIRHLLAQDPDLASRVEFALTHAQRHTQAAADVLVDLAAGGHLAVLMKVVRDGGMNVNEAREETGGATPLHVRLCVCIFICETVKIQ